MPPRVTYKHGPCHPGLLQHPLTVGGVIVNTCVGGVVAVRAGEEEVDFIDFTLQVHDAVLPPVRAQDSPFQNGTGHDPSDDNIGWAASLKHVMGASFPGTCLLKSRASVSFSFSRPSHTSYVSPRNLSRVYRCRRSCYWPSSRQCSSCLHCCCTRSQPRLRHLCAPRAFGSTLFIWHRIC